MARGFGQIVAIALVSIRAVHAVGSCPTVKSEGEPRGQIKDINGTQIYHIYPTTANTTSPKSAILYLSDIFGLPLLQNKLLADSLAASNFPVIFPDLFEGDAIPTSAFEGPGLNLTDWIARHNTPTIDAIIAQTVSYMRNELGIERIGAVGYCFGGKYVPRALAKGKGVDVGFIAHPSNLEQGEIRAVEGPLSIAAGQLDGSFNATARRVAEEILSQKGAMFQTTLYAQAPHGFAVRANMSVPAQSFAKEAAYLQALNWFEAWL